MSSATIPELTTSWWWIFRTLQTNAFVNHAGFPLRATLNWSHSFLRTAVVCYIINWQPCTSIWVQLHLIACCFPFLLRPVLGITFNCVSRVILSMAAFAASWWSKWCLRCSWVSAGGVLDEVPVILLDSVPLSPSWGVCGAMICCCGSEEMMITKRSGKYWGIYS